MNLPANLDPRGPRPRPTTVPTGSERDVDLSSFTRAQLDILAEQPGPLRHHVKEELLRRGGDDSAPRLSGETAGEIALSLLTDEQRAQVNAELTKRTATTAVETATASLATAVTQVATAVGQAQEAITAAPDGVDTTSLAEQVSALAPILPVPVEAPPQAERKGPQDATPASG